MEAFLATSGWDNAAGGFVLFTLLSPRLGQKVLGEWCQLDALRPGESMAGSSCGGRCSPTSSSAR